MRLISHSAIILITFLLSCDTASNVDPIFRDYFTKYYGEDGEQEGVDIVRNDDGSLILLGNSFSQSDPVSPFLVKTDASGNVIWQRTFKGQNERAVDIELINQGSQFAVVSNVERDTNNICLYILNQDGTQTDSLYITNSENQVAKSVTQSSDNGFLITGYQDPNPARNPISGNFTSLPDQADVLLLKVNSSLDVVDYLSPGGGEHVGSGTKVYELDLNGTIYYLVFGYSDLPRETNGEYQLCYQLISVVGSSNPTGLRGFSEAETDEEQRVSMTLKIPPSLGDGYLMVGTTSAIGGGGSSDLYLTRFNKPSGPNIVTHSLDAKIPLDRRIQGISAANAAPDGYFVVANEIRDNNKKDIFLLRVERDGAVTWTTSFGSFDGEDTVGGVEALPDGRIAVVGTIELETQRKMALIVTNANGKFSN